MKTRIGGSRMIMHVRVYTIVLVLSISFCSTGISIKRSVEISDLDTNPSHILKNSIIHDDRSYAVPWPGLTDSGFIQVKSFAWKTSFLDEKAGDMRSRVKTHLAALDIARLAVYIIYLDIMHKKNGNKHILKVKREAREHTKYDFHVHGGIIVNRRFDKYNRCEIVYRVPVSGIRDFAVKEKTHIDMKLLKEFAGSHADKKFQVDESTQKEKWIDENTLQIVSFGNAGNSSGNRRRKAKTSALIWGQSRGLEILKGVRVTKNGPYDFGTSDVSGFLGKTVTKDIIYDDNDNCQLTLIIKKDLVR